MVFGQAVPAGGMLKLLAVWKGPYRAVQVHQVRINVIVDADKEEPLNQKWTMMTAFETISKDLSFASFQEEFLHDDEPINRS